MDIGPEDDPLLEDALGSLLDMDESKGASELLGIILLIGVIMAVAAVVIGLGGTAIQQTQGESEIKHAQNTFSEMDSQLSAVALGEGPNQRSISLGLTQQGSDLRVEQDARIRIERYEADDDDDDSSVCIPYDESAGEECAVDGSPPVEETIGHLVYTHNGKEIAYQAGGIWERNQHDEFSYMLSPPPVEYEDATLTMPIVDIASDDAGLGGNSLLASQGRTEVPENASGPVKDDVIVVRIKSEYYEGWGNYFENHVEGNVDTCYYYEDGAGECNEDGELEENEIAVELGLTGEIRGSFGSALVADGDVSVNAGSDIHNGTIISSGEVDGVDDDRVEEHVELSLLELDPHINTLMVEARDNYEDVGVIDSGQTLEHTDENEGRYYAEAIDLESGTGRGHGHGDTLTLDVSEGDITLLVDGEISIEDGTSSINVVGAECGADAENTEEGEKCENHARVLTNNDFNLHEGSGNVYANTCDVSAACAEENIYPELFQLYGGSDMNVTIANGTAFEGVIYAPSSSDAHGGNMGNGANCRNADPNICIGGASSVTGAIVGGSTVVANGADVTYDEDLAELAPTVSPDRTIRPRLMNLHVSVNGVDVKG